MERVDPIIRNIVSRCHVSNTDQDVIRYVVSRLKDGWETYRSWPVWYRAGFIKQILRVHRANQSLYRRVVSGRV